jgi:hypothetical protein
MPKALLFACTLAVGLQPMLAQLPPTATWAAHATNGY